MVKLKQAIVVEGRYDVNTLRQLVDAPIFETRGFGIMNDRERLGRFCAPPPAGAASSS